MKLAIFLLVAVTEISSASSRSPEELVFALTEVSCVTTAEAEYLNETYTGRVFVEIDDVPSAEQCGQDIVAEVRDVRIERLRRIPPYSARQFVVRDLGKF